MRNGFTRHVQMWKKNYHNHKQSWNELVTNFLKDLKKRGIDEY